MPLSEFKTSAEVIAWEHRAFARTISLLVLCHRTDGGLSQTELAKHIGMSQQRIARLDLGEDDPTIDTLMQLSSGLGVEFTMHIRPNMPPDLVATGV